jgi:Flp pilus assembly protein TadG
MRLISSRPVRRGSVVPMLAVCVIALFSFVALAIDLGMMMVARTECQNAADSAALAGARTLDNRVPAGQTEDQYNNQNTTAVTNADTAITNNIFLSQNYTNAQITNVSVGEYAYNTTTQTFYPNFTLTTKPPGTAWSAVQVTVDGTQPTYFAKVLGITSMPLSAYAVAVHRPRDIALVLDFTGSMGYASQFTYNYNSGNGYYTTFMSSDTSYPQFGQYYRYLAYQNSNPNNNPADPTISNRPSPIYETGTVIAAPYVYGPGNFTITTNNGPPIISDFLFDPQNVNTPTTAAVPVNAANLVNAFTATTFNTAANARSIAGNGPTPAPDNFKDMSDSPVAYVGDKWPRKGGAATGTTWDPTNASGAAVNAAELLGWNSAGRFVSSSTSSNWPGTPPARSAPWSPTTAYASNWSNFRDLTWETYGYDMNVSDYIASRGTYDPRTTALTANTTGGVSGQVQVTSGKFLGYSMGPSYWGKTFFIWPPDPRAAKDWRLLYFNNSSGAAFTTSGTSVNSSLLTNGNGLTLNNPGGNWQPNYTAILNWIKSGPQVLPPNLRSGRIKYYTSIPSDVNTATGNTDQVADKQFWKQYINYVLTGDQNLSNGVSTTLAGFESVGWPETSAGAITPTIGTTSAYSTDPLPYMNYSDNPSRPRMHLWFGPLTMLSFIANKAALAGTTHQSQCWQLKAGVSSGLDDIKANHPNDLVGLAYFSCADYHDVDGRVAIGQNWTDLKNALFFPNSLLTNPYSSTTANSPNLTDTTQEIRVFDSSMNYTGRGNVPNAQSSTDPVTGFAGAFNLLAPSHYVNSDPSRIGRRGSAKIVIFETDGIPNASQGWTLNQFGYETYYSYAGGVSTGLTVTQAGSPALTIVSQIVKPMATTNSSGTDSGMSMFNNKARVYAIGFGDVFSTTAGPTAANFLLQVQQAGNTSRSTDTSIPSVQIITGAYNTRVANLRTALQQIFQGGVQVTLIQ